MEEQNIISETLGRKLYSERAVMIGTLLGGPFAGGYMITKNYKALGQSEKIGTAWLYTILIFVGLVVLAFIVPEQVPRALFFFLYAWLGHFAAQKLQGKFLEKHAAEGGTFYTNWRAAGIGLIVSLILIAIVLLGFLIMDVFAKG